MRKFIWWGTGIAVALWSIVAYVAYALVDLFGSSAAGYGSVPGFTPDTYSFGWFAEALHSLGLSVVLLVWLVGTLGILAGAGIGHAMTRRRQDSLPGRRSWGSTIPSGPPGRPGWRDPRAQR
ncbi:hypothetical protein [Phreatobacter sp. AB_2022a]|uniref:hypothetical protein n=1 Tax=Phreatobacter sp. AB_2022a TaxID=3003134 RepID=UPI0022871182|nr:hypothetical protein [Phreatobacter sp. AB_2022a]MCZ0735784.1 hypothetical protein [Phreatobacter sp. AB_2022a]